MNPVALTIVLRVIGILLVLPALFADVLLNLFPVLEDYPGFSNALFWSGVAVFAAGAVLHLFLRATGKDKRKSGSGGEGQV